MWVQFGKYVYTVDTFDHNAVSGSIKRQGAVYTAEPGVFRVTRNFATNINRRCFFQFDTSQIGDNSVIDKVEYRVSKADVNPPPLSTWIDIFLGSWIGVTLDANFADWNGGTTMNLNLLGHPSYDWIDLAEGGETPGNFISKTSTTDVGLHDESRLFSSNFYFETDAEKSQLRISYFKWTLPKVVCLFGDEEVLKCFSSMDLQAQP